MRIEFDPAKNERNIRVRGLPFDEAGRFDFETARVYVDERRDYGETRFVALGYLGARLHVLCFMEIEDGIRVLSFRKANVREMRRYAQVQATD